MGAAEKLKALSSITHPVPKPCNAQRSDVVDNLDEAMHEFHQNFFGFADFLCDDSIGGVQPSLMNFEDSIIAVHKKALTETVRSTVFVHVKNKKMKFEGRAGLKQYAEIFLRAYDELVSLPSESSPTLVQVLKSNERDTASTRESNAKKAPMLSSLTSTDFSETQNSLAVISTQQSSASNQQPQIRYFDQNQQQFRQAPSLQQFQQQPFQQLQTRPIANQPFSSQQRQLVPTHQQSVPRPVQSQIPNVQQRTLVPYTTQKTVLQRENSELPCYGLVLRNQCPKEATGACKYNHSKLVIMEERRKISQFPPLCNISPYADASEEVRDFDYNHPNVDFGQTSNALTDEELYNCEQSQSEAFLSSDPYYVDSDEDRPVSTQ